MTDTDIRSTSAGWGVTIAYDNHSVSSILKVLKVENLFLTLWMCWTFSGYLKNRITHNLFYKNSSKLL